MFSLDDIFLAYYDCRKNKRNTASAIEFEINYEINCIQLWRELNGRTYKPSRSIAFIVRRPRDREIFAANFRDRIVHHLIDMKIRPLLEKDFTPRTFNNRKGKGTSACVNQLKQDIKEAGDCWVMKLDIKGFFMSISKSRLTKMILGYVDGRYFDIDKEDLKWALSVTINDHPELNCDIRSPLSWWDFLDKEKSLFYIDPDRGIPIGNLISQLLANFYLWKFDMFVLSFFKFYGRYVDDFYIVDNDKRKILSFIPKIRSELSNIGLTLHPQKFYFQHYSKGIEMVGAVIKKDRTYVHNRTVNNAFLAIKKFEKIKYPKSNVEKIMYTVNSYLGFLKHHNTYAIRRNIVNSIGKKWWKYILVKNKFYSIIEKSKYNKRKQIKKLINKKL